MKHYKINVPKVYITAVPYNFRSYYLWLLYGLYELNEQGKIILSFQKMKLEDRLIHKSQRCREKSKRIRRLFNLQEEPIYSYTSYNLQGFIIYNDKKIKFCYDIADSPFLFDIKLLHSVDHYFKAQCPKEISSDGFPLTSSIRIPYHPDVLTYKSKIHASMIGPRCLCYCSIFDYDRMKAAYKMMINDKMPIKDGILMCYFGNACGPIPIPTHNTPDYNSESEIMGYFKEKISHPNEKRAILAHIISEKGKDYDARIINPGNSDTLDNSLERTDLIIPLNQFCKHISRFQYNLNVSGYRNSIPNRFIESFAVGTAILTDKLHVKWYLPFGKEVIELSEMGYLPISEINWNKVKQDIDNLPPVNDQEVLKAYNSKWAPTTFAEYIVDTVLRQTTDN